MAVVTRSNFASTNIKTFLLDEGYTGEGEKEFDGILQDIRAKSPDFLAARGEEDLWMECGT